MSVYSLDHPDIMIAERDGSLCRDEIKILGFCRNCGEYITDEYEYFVDDENFKFCTDKCYLEYYGIKKVSSCT